MARFGRDFDKVCLIICNFVRAKINIVFIKLSQMVRISIAKAASVHTTVKDKCNKCDGVAPVTANEGEIFNFRGVTRIRSNAKYSDF